jgi:hypothetical protein
MEVITVIGGFNYEAVNRLLWGGFPALPFREESGILNL